jgi:hypothetical protein
MPETSESSIDDGNLFDFISEEDWKNPASTQGGGGSSPRSKDAMTQGPGVETIEAQSLQDPTIASADSGNFKRPLDPPEPSDVTHVSEFRDFQYRLEAES